MSAEGGDARRAEAPARAPRWIGPIPLPRGAARAAWRFAGIAAPLLELRLSVAGAILAGSLPLLACRALGGGTWHAPTSAALLFLLFLACVREDRAARALAVVGAAYAAHSALALGLAWADPSAEACFPGGLAYWEKNLRWIRTGIDPEYELSAWVPAHGALFLAMSLFAYASLGLVPFQQGFYEVDLMNYYVGRLVATSDDPAVAVLLGWHAWSVARGVSYAVLVYEVASFSLSRMTGRPLSTPAARGARWSVAVAFFLLDAGLKVALLDPVRRGLAANLSP